MFIFHKLSDFLVNVNDDDNDDDQENDEEGNYEATHFFTIDYEEYKEQEATEEGTQDDEESDLVKIAPIVIASLPHSPRKLVTTLSMEKTSIGLSVTINDNTNIQSFFTLVQLNTSLTEASSNLSTNF